MAIKRDLWHIKLAAWLHDPAEKAMTLLRDREGHEWGTVKRLRDELEISGSDFLKKSDWYAAAADRPQFPLEKDGRRYAAWTQVDFSAKPVLKHPLTTDEYDLKTLKEIEVSDIKQISERHFRELIVRNDEGQPDLKKTLLNFWRFGPESPDQKFGLLWENMPADTRIPDHSIWSHLDIVSAFAGAMSADKDGMPALLAVSFGPVQGFIAESRTTSDLWAGSHLLACIAWEGMKVVCERMGPDAVLFPNLRGIPLVDVWLRDEIGLPEEKFEGMDWVKSKSDANPLFSAVLPNRFVALVPDDQVETIVAEVKQRVRKFVLTTGKSAIKEILEAIDEQDSENLPCYEQLDKQLQGFPEVYWASVPWSLAESEGKPDGEKLKQMLGDFYPEGSSVGFLDSPAWQVLQKDVDLDGAKFYVPNPGVLYPALYELLDRVSAAAKSVRSFTQFKQTGYRSSLNGEREWLTLDYDQLELPPGQRHNTLWLRLADQKPSWAKTGEHLDSLNTIKRLWPVLFAKQAGKIVGEEIRRYVVSTHLLAIATSIERWIADEGTRAKLCSASRREKLAEYDAVSLPYSLYRKIQQYDEDTGYVVRRLPSALEQDVDGHLANEIKHDLKERPEAYYGLILLDGDRMGAWLAGNEDELGTTYIESWHPAVRNSVEQRFDRNSKLMEYLRSARSSSPARHQAISEALNHFSLRVARFVIEECFKGKLVYAGGDDVLALVCVDDLLPAMTLLRYLYSGEQIPEWLQQCLGNTTAQFRSNNGYVYLDRDSRLLLTMGRKATASCGALIVHHQAPLGYVLGRLREAESEAKTKGGRNAFSLKVIKRAGGELEVTDKWWRGDGGKYSISALLFRLMKLISQPGVSRRAAYNSVTWLQQLPESPDLRMIEANLVYQFRQQCSNDDTKQEAMLLAQELTEYIRIKSEEATDTKPADFLANILMTGEFLARESRFKHQKPEKNVEDAA